METEKAYCIVNKKTGKISTTLYGSNENLAFNVYPMNKAGLKNAEGSFTGLEEVRECKITILKKEKHICNCKYCEKIIN